MVLQLFLGILAVVALFLLVSRKRRRLWPLLMLGFLVLIGVLFFEHYRLLSGRTIVYHWLSYKGLQAQFIITSDAAVTAALRMLLPALGSLLYLNIICHREEYPLAAGNIMLLTLAAFIFMISSRDFMQLMAGSCCFSILGFYLINETTAKNKFLFYNFSAEMAVFTALAVVYAKTGTISLDSLGSFARDGWHRDLVGLLLLIGILIKCGMFLFQNQLLDLQRLGFNRLLEGSLLVAPLSGLVLYAKLHPLLGASEYTLPVLNTVLALTVLCSLSGMLWNDNLKAKILYFNMLFFAFALFLLSQDAGSFFSAAVILLPAVMLVDWCLMMISVSASDEIYVSQMGGFIRPLKWNLILTLAAVAVFAGSVLWLGSGRPFLIYLFVALFALAAILHAVYLGPCHADEKVAALLKNAGWRYAWLLLAVIPLIGYYFPAWSNPLLSGSLLGFLALWLLLPQKLTNLFASNEAFQERDWLSAAYQLLIVSPLRLLGRILWLAVDFVVIERSVIGTLSSGMGMLERGLEKSQSASWRSYLFLAAVGLALLLINIGMYAHE